MRKSAILFGAMTLALAGDADLRRSHLAAHLEMKNLLTSEQIAAYDRLPGYGVGGSSAQGHGGHGPTMRH
ncbi:MAG: hypothetical protein ACRCUE_10760 [Bosea sp. (in: a-proteobacteria)]